MHLCNKCDLTFQHAQDVIVCTSIWRSYSKQTLSRLNVFQSLVVNILLRDYLLYRVTRITYIHVKHLVIKVVLYKRPEVLHHPPPLIRLQFLRSQIIKSRLVVAILNFSKFSCTLFLTSIFKFLHPQ